MVAKANEKAARGRRLKARKPTTWNPVGYLYRVMQAGKVVKTETEFSSARIVAECYSTKDSPCEIWKVPFSIGSPAYKSRVNKARAERKSEAEHKALWQRTIDRGFSERAPGKPITVEVMEFHDKRGTRIVEVDERSLDWDKERIEALFAESGIKATVTVRQVEIKSATALKSVKSRKAS